MRRSEIHLMILSTALALTSCSSRSSSRVPVGQQNQVSEDHGAIRMPSERVGTRGAARGPDESLPNPNPTENPGGGTTTPTPTPAPTPVPPAPTPEPTTEPVPTPGPSGQTLNGVSTYCSDNLVKWSEASMESVSTLKFHFFATNRSNFLTYLVWDKGTDATGLKNSLKQGNAVLPQFTDVADGVYDVLVCNQADEQCDFLYSFNTFSLYNAIMDGYAYGVVGIVHLHIASGKITSYDNGWFLYPSNTNQVTCNKSY